MDILYATISSLYGSSKESQVRCGTYAGITIHIGSFCKLAVSRRTPRHAIDSLGKAGEVARGQRENRT